MAQTLQLYFQQIWPLAGSDADDGRVVGQMLIDLVESKPKDLAPAIREFAYRTAMLRDCSLRHIGVMLVTLLTAGAQDGPSDAPIVVLDPSLMTEQQAITLGSVIASSAHRSRVPTKALHRIVGLHAVLRAMKSAFVWFVPMLEVMVAHKAAEPRRSTLVKRLSSIVSVNQPSVTPIDVTSSADGADEESGFSSVVQRCSSLTMPWRPRPRFWHGLLQGFTVT